MGKEKVLQLCSNHCTLAKSDCDGFYVSKVSDVFCHLVNHDHPQTGSVEPKVGHGEDLWERVYYVKKQIGTNSIEKPEQLIPP